MSSPETNGSHVDVVVVRAKLQSMAEDGRIDELIVLVIDLHIKASYELEKEYKEHKLSSDDRLVQRANRSVPLVDELYQWIRDIESQAIPKTPLYAAIRYAKNQEDAWRRCFSEGKFEIDNGEAERRLRWVALGRKNFLFAGSDTSAERLAVGYTLTGSCHANGVNPLEYLTDAIDKLQSGWPLSRLDELLPNVWRPGLT